MIIGCSKHWLHWLDCEISWSAPNLLPPMRLRPATPSSVPCRKRQNGRVDLALLDRNNKAGWQLARKLICKRNILNRGRLSAGAALRNRYFWPEF